MQQVIEADPGQAGATPEPVRRQAMSDTVSFAEYQKVVAQATTRKSTVRELEARLAAITKERDDAVSALAARTKEFEDLLVEHEQLAGEADDALTVLERERDEWQQKYEQAPSEHLTELQAMKEQVKERKHRDKFNEVADKLRVRKEALDDVWSLSQYKAESDEPDEAQITKTLTGLIEAKRYLVQEPEVAEADASQSAPGGASQKIAAVLKRGPGADRGGAATKVEDVAPASTQAKPSGRGGDPFRIA